jgi:DNA helicase IV
VLRPHVNDRWQLAELTVNYRTPAQIMDLAAAMMRANGSSVRIPTSARVGRSDPAYTQVAGDAATSRVLPEVVRAELAAAAGGTVVVITSAAALVRARAMVDAALDSDALVSVLTVRAAKGLEFDAVIVLEPAEILAESARGLNDLYVALTRATQRLHLVYAQELPAGL